MDKTGIGAVAVGGIFTYAGLKGFSVPQAIQYLVQGKNPATLPQTTGIDSPTAAANTTGGTGTPVANSGSAQQILQQTAAQYGWGSGAEWQALQSIEMHEAGFDPKATNPSKGHAFGLAQALGHGNSNTQGTLSNNYGGYGLSDAQAKQANSGDASMQALWMCNYIKSRYGDPIKAWAYWQAHNSY